MMSSRTMARGHHSRGKSPHHHFTQVCRITSLAQERIQDLIVLPDQGIHLVSVQSSFLRLLIVILRLAVIATESLVRAAISYQIPTLQTIRHVPFILLIMHRTFWTQNS